MSDTPSHSDRNAQSILWAVVSLLLVAIFGGWIAVVESNAELRAHLARWTVLAMDAAAGLMLFGVFLGRRGLGSCVAAVSRPARLALLGLLVCGGLTTALVAPCTNRIYYDEQIYENIGQNIAWTGRALLCNEGDAEFGEYKPYATEYNKQPNGQPYYFSLFFRLFGVHDGVAHAADNASYLLAVFAVFVIVRLLFRSERAALFAAAFYAATPMVLTWSNTAAAEPSAAAFSALAVMAACVYSERPCATTALFLAGALVFAIQFRPESLLVAVPAAMVVPVRRPTELCQPRLYWTAALVSLLALPELLHLFAVRNEGWGTTGERFSLTSFAENLPVNGLFYLHDRRFPAVFSAFALIGLLWPSGFKARLPILVWFLYAWGLFLFFYAGSYHYGADVRYSLVSAAPLAVLAGLGAGGLTGLRVPRFDRRAWAAVVILATALLWSKFLPLVRAVGEESSDARLDVEHAREFARLVPVNAIVLTHNPGMWLVWGKNAAQMSIATDNRQHVDRDFFARYKGGVYLHWDFWCNVPDPVQNAFGENIRRDYRLELVKQYEERGFRYALYRVFPK